MPKLELSLDGPWRFKAYAQGNGEELGAYKPENSGDRWLPAQVPGVVHLDLLANDFIPDPFRDLNESRVQWVTDNEWWYLREFKLSPAYPKKQVVEAVFDGLDTFATVWVNGIRVGEANDMFTKWRFNITKAVNPGSNVIAVRFKPVYQATLNLERQFGGKYGFLHSENFSARPYVRKAQCHFGWDWGPTLATAGIWRHVKIIAYNKARLGYLSTLPLKVTKDNATIKAVADVYAPQSCEVTAKFTLKGYGQKLEEEVVQSVDAGESVVECEFEVSQPRLWWPRGYGEQDLYDVSVEIYNGKILLDRAEAKCGIRSIRLLQETDDEGKCFVFVVNDLPVFCRGASWIPADSFLPRVTVDRYRGLLTLAAEANFNMIRVWGGGIYENDEFYDLCDELGIMIWQDFTYACSAYPEDDWFLQLAEREADDVVRRLRGHPSIVVWCGNNEIQWQFQTQWKDLPRLYGLPIWEKILPQVLCRLDETRPYRASTPYDTDINGEHEGSRHNWVVWSKGVDYPAYLDDKGRFLTEFGWQAPPSLRLLNDYFSSEMLALNSPALEAHEKQEGGLDLLQELLLLHYPPPQNLKQLVLYGQLNQADALKTAVTHWRSRMFKTGGCLIWQLNDCWPVVSWSLIDYELKPKAAYYAVRHSFQPIIATLNIKEDKIRCCLVNETAEETSLTFEFKLQRFTGETLSTETANLTVTPYTSTLILLRDLAELPIADDSFFIITLKKGDEVIFEDSRTCKDPKDLNLPSPQLKMDFRKLGVKTFEVQLKTPVYSKAVYLEAAGSPNFSDNFFDLLPNKPKSVICKTETDISLRDFKDKLKWQAYPYQA